MSGQQPTLELAILGYLAQGPSYGYEIRKQISQFVVGVSQISFGSLYPALRRLTSKGLICDCQAGLARLVQGRARRTYHLTANGRTHLQTELHNVVPVSDDDSFLVRFLLFDLIDSATRLAILKLRKSELKSRLKIIRKKTKSAASYTAKLLQHKDNNYCLEIEWLDGLIAGEQLIITKEKR